MNLPNKLSILRVLMVPVFMAVLLIWPGEAWAMWVGLAIFIIASLTDYADGVIARKYNLVTDFGKFIDPLADKILVVAALLVFVQWGTMPSWAAMVVITREFAVSGLRMIAASNGTVMAAAMSGKIKTASSMVCICAMLTPIGGVSIVGGFTVNWLCTIVIVLTTVISGVEYFAKNIEILKDC